MKVTYKQLIIFRQMAKRYIDMQGSKSNKLTWACMKLRRVTENLVEDFAEKESDIRVHKASLDDKGNFILDKDGQYIFKPNDLLEVSKKMRLLHDEVIEVEPYIVTIVPKELPISWYEYLAPFVLNELDEPSDEECLKSEEKTEPVQ